MSVALIAKVREINAGIMDRAMLEVIADQCNDHGMGLVSRAALADRLGLSERGARNIYKRLEDYGLVQFGQKIDGFHTVTVHLGVK